MAASADTIREAEELLHEAHEAKAASARLQERLREEQGTDDGPASEQWTKGRSKCGRQSATSTFRQA